jgi:hypothetical protein
VSERRPATVDVVQILRLVPAIGRSDSRNRPRQCENFAGVQGTSKFRGLWRRRARKIAKTRALRGYTEFLVEFSHSLDPKRKFRPNFSPG